MIADKITEDITTEGQFVSYEVLLSTFISFKLHSNYNGLYTFYAYRV